MSLWNPAVGNKASVFTSYRFNHFAIDLVDILSFVDLLLCFCISIFKKFLNSNIISSSLRLQWTCYTCTALGSSAFFPFPKWRDSVSQITVKTLIIRHFCYLVLGFLFGGFCILSNFSAFLEKDHKHNNFRQMALLLLKAHLLSESKRGRRRLKQQVPAHPHSNSLPAPLDLFQTTVTSFALVLFRGWSSCSQL